MYTCNTNFYIQQTHEYSQRFIGAHTITEHHTPGRARTRTQTHKHAWIYAHAHTHTHTHTHTYMHFNIFEVRTQIHTHTQTTHTFACSLLTALYTLCCCQNRCTPPHNRFVSLQHTHSVKTPYCPFIQTRFDGNQDMGWLSWVGSLKLKVSFAKEPYKRDSILQKRPIILRSLLIVATP